jgi:hypothetical protein
MDEEVRKMLEEVRETCGIPEEDVEFRREAALLMLRHALEGHRFDDLLGKGAEMMDKFFLLQRGPGFPATSTPLSLDAGTLPPFQSPAAAQGVSPPDLVILDSPFPVPPPLDPLGQAPFLASDGRLPPPKPPTDVADGDSSAPP